MEAQHLRSHLYQLRQRVAFLRSLRPDSPSYHLWLGDVVELVNTVWGSGSPQMQQITAALTQRDSGPILNGGFTGERAYVRRVDSLDAVLAGYERDLDR
ncbi:MAG: hypothetical protein ACR2PL_02700 [Dehalococcoidia bacterium]